MVSAAAAWDARLTVRLDSCAEGAWLATARRWTSVVVSERGWLLTPSMGVISQVRPGTPEP